MAQLVINCYLFLGKTLEKPKKEIYDDFIIILYAWEFVVQTNV